MSRVRKTRFWDTQEKEFVSDWMAVNGDRIVVNDGRELIEPADVSRFIPSDFTGLKDKNGLEIYEGDIVHYLYQPGKGFWNSDSTALIVWANTGFAMRPITGKGCMNGWLCSAPGAYMPECQELFEVIGNTHQNPELLEPAP